MISAHQNDQKTPKKNISFEAKKKNQILMKSKLTGINVPSHEAAYEGANVSFQPSLLNHTTESIQHFYRTAWAMENGKSAGLCQTS